MSARAAWRLEAFGFKPVYRYTAGKADWLANGWPVEGRLAGAIRAADLARKGVITCNPGENAQEAWERARAAGWTVCVVANEEQVVAGLLREEPPASDTQVLVEQVMELAPRTYRLNAEIEKIAAYMRKYSVDQALVTTSDGKLVGLLERQDVEGAIASASQEQQARSQ